MRITEEQFFDMLDQASDEELMMSRMNCHAMRVSSIVLRKYDNCLTRAFLAWPGHTLHRNAWPADKLEVGIHSHRYNVELSLICGYVTNEVYVRSTHGPMYNEYRYTSGVESGEPKIESTGCQRLVRSNNRGGLLTGSQLLSHDDLHTVAAFGPAAWLVAEGRTRRDTTQLFTNNPASLLPNPVLYQPYENAMAVRRDCYNFFAATFTWNGSC